jgi:hypothetical protein
MGVVGGFFFKRTVLSVFWENGILQAPLDPKAISIFIFKGQRRSLALHPMIANTNPRLTEGGRYHC